MADEMTMSCQHCIWFCSNDTSKETGSIHTGLGIPQSSQSPFWVTGRCEVVYGKTSGEYLVHRQGPSAEVVFSLPQPPGGTALRWLTAGTHTAAVQQARAGRLQAQEAEWMPQDVQKHSLKPCCTAAGCWEATAGANLRQASEMERLFLQKRVGRPWDLKAGDRLCTSANEPQGCRWEE